MKIHIITIHHIHNFGSVFQAYCLQKYLLGLGHDVEIIDYRPSYYNSGRNKLKSFIGKVLNLKTYISRKRKYDDFIKNNDILSQKTYFNESQLQTEYKNSNDLFIAGGDQLWNSYHPCGKDDAYKLLFTNSPHKMAIGTSLGRNNQSADELNELSKRIELFKSVFLREKSTVDTLSKYISIPCKHVIDPVGLLNVDELKRMAVKPNDTKPYAVMYLADSGELLDQSIKSLSRDRRLKIVHICGFRKKCYCDKFEKDTGPQELLGYILYSDFVISASFHATLFSIIFNKPFATLLPNVQTNERIESLLKYFGLENRIVKNVNDIGRLNQTIDFEPVNEKLDLFRAESKEYIEKALTLCGL